YSPESGHVHCTGSCLFDQLICTKNESGRDCKPKDLRCFCVHGQFKPGWLLNGQIAWLSSVQDLGNVSHRSAIHVWKAWAVCDQTTISNVRSVFPNRRPSILRSKLD